MAPKTFDPKLKLQYLENPEIASEKLTDWEAEPSVMALKGDLQMATPFHDTQVKRIAHWIRLRDQERTEEENKLKNAGRSRIKPKLVRRQSEWRYSALSEPFLSSDAAIEVSARTWEDVKGAEQNGIVLNWQIDTQLNWVSFIDEYVRTCVDEGTVPVRVGWEQHSIKEEVEATVWTYVEPQSEQDAQLLAQAAQMQVENPTGFLQLPEEWQESVSYSAQIGQPAIAMMTGTQMVQRKKITRNRPTLEIWDWDNLYIDPTCGGNIEKANFAIFAFETSQAELKKDGRYKNLDKVSWEGSTAQTDPQFAQRTSAGIQFKDTLRMKVVAHEYWGFYDVHGDGVLVPIVATWIGNTMIRMELNPFPDQKIPLVVVRYMPVKKSVTGEPDAELLEDNQDILGAVMRGIIDLMARSANGQTGIAKGMLDAVNKKRYDAGANYEFNPGSNPQMSFFQHKFPELPQSALTVIQMQNQEAEALTGVKAFSGGLSGNAYGDVAAGARAMMDAASKREMSILRRLAKGVEEIAAKIITMNQAFLSEEEVVRVTNEEFVTIRREDLAGNFDVKVDITTPEIEETQSRDLSFLLQTLGPTVGFDFIKMILVKLTKLKRMPDLSHSLENFEPKPDPMEQQLKQLEMQKLQAEIQKLQADAQASMAKASLAGAQVDLANLDFLEQENGTKHMRRLDELDQQANANSNLEVTKAILNPGENGQKRDLTAAIRFKNLAQALTSAQ